jgi:hypothetical protein
MAGIIQSAYKKSLIDEMLYNISTNTSYYYAFASNPVAYSGGVPNTSSKDYSTEFENDWLMLFGKKLSISNFAPLIQNNIWDANTIYRKYDNSDPELYSNNLFYAICEPEYDGGTYNVYKCLDNGNDSPSSVKPTLVQTTSFATSDGYVWKYVTSIPFRLYRMFATEEYAPLYANAITSIYANVYAGVEKVVIENGGTGYSTYHEGTILSANTTVIQIENEASIQSGYYTGSAIYIYNTTATTSQIFNITEYVANSVGKWIYLDKEANTDNILPQATRYKISPSVHFVTDGGTQPIAYTTINPEANSISDVVILETGADISWANVTINALVGQNANVYAIVPPAGGHGSDALSELNIKALGVNFHFANTEGDNIPTWIQYNKIGIIKNPYQLYANGAKSNTQFTGAVFSQVMECDVSNPVVYTIGDRVYGNTSNAYGIVAYSNTTKLYVTGDKTFIDGEYVFSSNGVLNTEVDIVSKGDIYAKSLKPLYVQNINNVNRSNTQTESFKLIIQI